MKTLYVEILMGHDVGLKESYDRADEGELLAEYLKAAPELTFLEPPAWICEDVESLKAELQSERRARQNFEARLARIEAAVLRSLGPQQK